MIGQWLRTIFPEQASSKKKTVLALGLTDFKGQAIGNILTCVTAGAWNFHDSPSLGQTLAFIKGRAAHDPLLPDVLSSLIDLAEVIITAILERLITLQCHDLSSSQLNGTSCRQTFPTAFALVLLFLVTRGAGLTGGLPALQLESGDEPHLDCAVASRAHINHQTFPGPNDGAIEHAGFQGLAATGGTTL